ncbi:MAG: CYTH domain-containing protein [Gammaproteobacteria bacterium]|nr:CYTH domain-containing protein [Gammaproteobacteria bacterium]
MGIEIERKYLVDVNSLPDLGKGEIISQGYVETTTRNVVRARVKGDVGFLTLKGESTGISCSEFEYEIPINDALEIISTMCSGKTVEKTRYERAVGDHIWEIDFFHGKNDGLVVAEIELGSENEVFEIPVWVKEEVTGQVKYYNSRLLINPFAEW